MTHEPIRDDSALTYFDGTVSVRSGVYRCLIHGVARTRKLFVAVQVAGTSIEDSFCSSQPLQADLLEWIDLDRALRLAGELGARAKPQREPPPERRWHRRVDGSPRVISVRESPGSES